MENTNLCRQEILEKLRKGTFFKGTHTPSMHHCEPLEINEEENSLIVIYAQNDGYAFETEFELDMTLNGFEINEYEFI